MTSVVGGMPPMRNAGLLSLKILLLQISWFRRDKKLHETDRQLFHLKGGGRLTLHIRRLRPSDFGDYSCKAQNGLGEAKAHTSLTGR